jgi:hypothetical protein
VGECLPRKSEVLSLMNTVLILGIFRWLIPHTSPIIIKVVAWECLSEAR